MLDPSLGEHAMKEAGGGGKQKIHAKRNTFKIPQKNPAQSRGPEKNNCES
jgi:hypothetical protein